MANKTIMFVTLVVCGTVCILASLVTLAYEYHLHAPLFEANRRDFPPELTFLFFIGLPCAAGMLIGFKLAKTGVDIGTRS